MRCTFLFSVGVWLIIEGGCAPSESGSRGEEKAQTAEIKTSSGERLYFKTGLWRVRTRMEGFEKMGLKMELPEVQTEFCMDEMMAQAKRAPFGGIPSKEQTVMPDCKLENLRVGEGRMRYDLVCPGMHGEVDIKFSETDFEGEYKIRREGEDVMAFRVIGEYVGNCETPSE
ncbi:MAG: DUF3617 family protein [Bacteroidia bacterium]|nr:DUF3617 domain-containing protein [Bacteroidia bacterium]MDW8134135.1 DUF3617 family protein [Bacteroidia bacterium]